MLELLRSIFAFLIADLIIILSMRQSKTTHNLITEFARIKEEKQNIVDLLNDEIGSNNKIISEPLISRRSYSQKTIMNRQKSIELLRKRLNQKLEADRQSDARLQAVSLQTQKKRDELERRLEQIAKRNSQRLKELKEIEQSVLKRIAFDIQRNQVKEKHLKEQYQRIRKGEKEIKEVKKQQKKESVQQWRLLQSEKYKLQLLARENEGRQKKLVEERNPTYLKKKEQKKEEDKLIPREKQAKRQKNPNKVDFKQIGRKYLEQAKLMQRQAVVIKKKKKLMNVNLKVINYNMDIMEKIFRNTSDLSKVQKPVLLANTESKLPQVDLNADNELAQLQKVRSAFVLPEDGQTQRYLRQIRVNLSQLQRINSLKNYEQVRFESDDRQSEQLLVPATFSPG